VRGATHGYAESGSGWEGGLHLALSVDGGGVARETRR